MCIHSDTLPQCDGRTDGQICHNKYSVLHADVRYNSTIKGTIVNSTKHSKERFGTKTVIINKDN